MGKELVKKAGAAATESVLRSFMPELLERMDSMSSSLTGMKQQFELLRHELQEQLEQRTAIFRDLINELGLRIKGVETKVDVYSTLIRDRNELLERWLERLVRVEIAQNPRRRKAS